MIIVYNRKMAGGKGHTYQAVEYCTRVVFNGESATIHFAKGKFEIVDAKAIQELRSDA